MSAPLITPPQPRAHRAGILLYRMLRARVCSGFEMKFISVPGAEFFNFGSLGDTPNAPGQGDPCQPLIRSVAPPGSELPRRPSLADRTRLAVSLPQLALWRAFRRGCSRRSL